MVGDLYEIIPTCYMTNQVGLNVLYYEVLSQTGADLTSTQIAEYFDGILAPLYKPLINNIAIYCGTSAQKLTPPISPKGVGNANFGNGTAGAIALPTGVTGLGSKNTLLGGRRYYGRIYVPFPAAADDTGAGTPTAGYLARLQDLFATLESIAVPTAGAQVMDLNSIVYSKKYGLKTSITTISAEGNWATQRRRSAYGRPNPRPF